MKTHLLYRYMYVTIISAAATLLGISSLALRTIFISIEVTSQLDSSGLRKILKEPQGWPLGVTASLPLLIFLLVINAVHSINSASVVQSLFT